MAKVSLKHVSKRYGQVEVVKDFNLEIEDGEFIVFVGPSGCGKTTTLRMIAGLEEISAGEIFIGDLKVNDLPPKDRDIAMVFQNYALYPHMNVYENMAFGLKLRGLKKDEIDRRVIEAAKILQIETLLKRKPRELSGGQRQRVAMGRAIVREPKLFLMDEPLSNLDAKLRVAMRAEILKLHQKLRTTTIYVTHDQTEAMTMGDRIVVMKDGVVQQVDTPLNLYKSPANMFVAGFIGSPQMNFLTVKVVKEESGLYLSGDGFKVMVPAAWGNSVEQYLEREVVFGIRPEHIHDEPAVVEGLSNSSFKATIELVEVLGFEAYLHLKAGNSDLLARVNARRGFKEGEQITLAFDPNHFQLFDPATEKVL